MDDLLRAFTVVYDAQEKGIDRFVGWGEYAATFTGEELHGFSEARPLVFTKLGIYFLARSRNRSDGCLIVGYRLSD